ncbi:MAG TPA: hypothetical protein VIL74_14170 [Pyrinomonadaceae bacterium]|jgi:hypothetical protein
MSKIPTWRLYLLRAGYLFIAVGLALMIWGGIIFPGENVPHMNTVVRSMLGAVSLLALLGIFYPLQMLPVMLFEFLWKLIWLVAFGLPFWSSGHSDAGMSGTLGDNLVGIVIVLVVTPWEYLFKHYFRSSRQPESAIAAETARGRATSPKALI